MLEMLLGASGGIFGIVGALVKHGLEVYQEKQQADKDLAILREKNSHDLAMMDKQTSQMEMEAKNGVRVAEITANASIESSAYSALASSYESDKATYSNDPNNKWLVGVDVFRGSIRPGLALYFAMFLSVMLFLIWWQLPPQIYKDVSFLTPTFFKLVDALIFLATSSIGWYFAARPSTKQKD